MIRESVRQTRLREPGTVRAGAGAVDAVRAQNPGRSLPETGPEAESAGWLNFRSLRNAMARGWHPGEPIPEDSRMQTHGLPAQDADPAAASPFRSLVQRLQQDAGAAPGPALASSEPDKKSGSQEAQDDFPPQPEKYKPLSDDELYIRLHAIKESFAKNSTLDLFRHSQTFGPAISERVCEAGKTALDLRDDLSRFGKISSLSMQAYKDAERAAEQLNLTPAQLNAFRHVLWSCALSRELNRPDLAYNIMRNHEECSTDPEQKLGTLDSETDLWNNRYGITMSRKQSAKSCEAIARDAISRSKPVTGNKEKK